MTEIEKMEVCKICEKYLTANVDTKVCFRCQQKIEDAENSGEDLTDCLGEDIVL